MRVRTQTGEKWVKWRKIRPDLLDKETELKDYLPAKDSAGGED